MRAFMEKVADRKIGARNTDPVVAVFEERFEETFKWLAEGGRTPALWVQNHHMADEIKVVIRTEQLAGHNGHLSCIATKITYLISLTHLCCRRQSSIHRGHMAGTHKGTWNFVCLQGHIRTFTCQCEECCPLLQPWMSGTWCDICTEQTLMKAAKSEGGLSRGRKRNSFFLATNAGCSPSITYLMLTSRWRKTSVNMLHFTQTCSRHWCSEMQRHLNFPILGQTSPQTILGFRRTSQYNRHKELLSQCWESSWSRDRDGDQPGLTVSDIDYVNVKSKAKALPSLRKISIVNKKKIHLDSLK